MVAAVQQLQAVVSGGLCKNFCDKMQTVELKTVYRSVDEQHLVFLNRIRETQPDKSMLQEYFADRHWRHLPLEDCIRSGFRMAEEAGGIPFTWLTVTNAGASEVCRAALRVLGIDDAESVSYTHLTLPTKRIV